MSEVIWVIGSQTLISVVKNHTSALVLPWPSDQAIARPDIVIDATLGPLAAKRQRLDTLARQHSKIPVLTASTTVLLQHQRRWVNGALDLMGFDPWLMQIDAKIITLTGVDKNPLALRALEGWEWQPVADQVGGVFSRVIAPLVNEAMAYVGMGLEAEGIDAAIRLGLNHPQGALEWGDTFGLSQVGLVLQAMRQTMGERFVPHPLIQQQMAKEGVDLNA